MLYRMLDVYRWQFIMNRVSVFVIIFTVVFVMVCFEPFKTRTTVPDPNALTCEHKIRRSSEQGKVDWQNVFSFVPVGFKSCQQLFQNVNKEEPYDQEFVKKRLIFKERIKATYKQVDKRMGHTGKFIEEALVMHTLVKQPFVQTVCETGFNAGHGAFLWLQSNPNVTVFSFDINEYSYVRPMAKFLQKMYPGRLGVTFGDSRLTIPEFHATHPEVTCDLVLIDGGHIYDVAKQDLENFRMMATRNTLVIYDNYPQKSMNTELGQVWETAKQRGEVWEMFRCDYEPEKEQGFSVGRFNPDSLL